MFSLYLYNEDTGAGSLNAIRKGDSGDSLLFQVMFLQTPRRHIVVKLKSVCGPGDRAEPVVTIMLPGED